MDARPAEIARPRIRVLVVDDHPTLGESMLIALGRWADLELLGAVESGEAAVEQVQALGGAIDVVLMDVEMPGMGGLVATERINAQYPRCRVILLTTAERYAAAGRKAGALGYVRKVSRVQDVLAAIRAVHRGTLFFEVAPDTVETLTDTEVKILDLVGDSYTNSEIGQRLGLSDSAIKFHLRNITAKLGANGREQAVRIAVRQGIIR